MINNCFTQESNLDSQTICRRLVDSIKHLNPITWFETLPFKLLGLILIVYAP